MDVVTLGAALSIMKKMPDTAASSAAAAEDAADRAEEAARTFTIDSTLTQPGQPADSKAVGDTLAEKLDIADLPDTVSNANQLLSEKYVVDTEPYHLRPSGGNGADRAFDTIVGGSIVWNQLVINGNFSTDDWSAFRTTYTVENNIATVSITNVQYASVYRNLVIPANRKILVSFDAMADQDGAVSVALTQSGMISINRNLTANVWKRCTGVCSLANASAQLYLYSVQDTNVITKFKNVNVFDLTAMFGSEIADHIYELEQAEAGAGVAWFRKYFPNDYYEYNPGELMHVTDLQSHDTIGFNLLDSDTVLEAIGFTRQSDDSFYVAVSSSVANKTVWKNKTNYSGQICVSYSYKYDSAQSQGVRFMFVYTDETTTDNYASASTSYSNKTIVSSANKTVDFIKFICGTGTVATWLKDICINLSGTRDGEYEPYVKHSYPLDSSLTLRGVPKLTADGDLTYDGDIYKPDGTVERRYGIVDLGTLTWSYNSTSKAFITTELSSSIKPTASDSDVPKFIQNKYNQLPRNQVVFGTSDKVICENITGTIGVSDLSYTDVATLKAAMSGVYLVYELAEPTTEEAEPYQSPQILDPYGTEEYVTTSIVPVGHETKYPENLRAKIEGLPWNFASLIAPVEAEFKATRNYISGSLFIVNNTLYKATANIANGGTITPNTNCTATTLAEIIAAL